MANMLTLWAFLLEARLANAFLFAGALFIFYHLSQAVYRLYFHPISGFLGPRKAALTNAWLHQTHKLGKQEETFEKLHKQYGTSALRVGPNELHISDVSLYKTIYRQSHPFPKDKNFYDGFLEQHSVFQESDFGLHKEQRRLLNPYFSRAGDVKIEGMVQGHVVKLYNKLKMLSQRGVPIDIHNASRCGTVDIITEFAFGRSRHLIDGSDDRFHAPFLTAFDAASAGVWDSVYLPLLRTITTSLPRSLVRLLSPEMTLLLDLIDEGAQDYQRHKATLPKRDSQTPTIFDSLAHLPDEDVISEASDILVAGSDTTAFTLYTGIKHICANRTIKEKLTDALRTASPSKPTTPPSVFELEGVPYLRACIKESLRLAMPVRGRLPRIVPADDRPLIVDGNRIIPPGTSVGMSAYTMHFSEELWGADAKVFNPDRWMDEKQAKELEAYLVTFSKGARNCIGQNLAMAELFMMFYMVFRNFDVGLEEVGKVEAADRFITAIVGEGRTLLKLTEIE